MTAPIEFHFDIISPYALPGLVAIERVAEKHGRAIEMHPMLLGVSVVKAMGLPPLLDTPLKGDYILMDAPRAYRFHGIPFNPGVPGFMTSPLVPLRLFCWMLSQDRAAAQQAMRALMMAHWTEGVDVTQLPNALPHVTAAGFDADEATQALDDPAVKQDLKDRAALAVERQIFGSPTFIVDGEQFWGSDRTHIIDRWLETGGWL